MTIQNGNEANVNNSFDKKGVVYILDNEAYRDWYKIGRTKYSGHKRAKQLNKEAATGIPAAYFCIFQFETLDCYKAESLVHQHFEKHRIAKGEKKKAQEFFKFNLLELEEVKIVIKRICNEINDEITGEAKRRELEKQRIVEAEERRIQRKIEFEKKQAQERQQKEFEEKMRLAEERRIEQIKNDEAARKARELEEALKKNTNASKDKIHVDDKKDLKAQSKIKNVYCTVCGKQNRVPSYENDKRPICGNCKSPLWSEINRKTYEMPIDKLSNGFEYTNSVQKNDIYKESTNDDKLIDWEWFIIFGVLFLIWILNSGQKVKQPNLPSVVNYQKPVPPKPAQIKPVEPPPPVDNWVHFREDWKKIEEEKKVEEQKASVAPIPQPKSQVKKVSTPKKELRKFNKTKDLRYCLEIENVAAFNKCVNQ